MHSELAGCAYFKDLICKYYTYIYNFTYITIVLGYFQMVYTKIIKWTIYIIVFSYFFRIFFFKSREGSIISWGVGDGWYSSNPGGKSFPTSSQLFVPAHTFIFNRHGVYSSQGLNVYNLRFENRIPRSIARKILHIIAYYRNSQLVSCCDF